jgi:mannitol-1-phosphate 5-dehydrogenase
MADRESIVIFGAGKIGRSFIGQIFGLSGYRVVFVDIDGDLVDALNRQKSYPVVIRSDDSEEVIMVPHVSAINALNVKGVEQSVAEASLLAVCVGKNVLIHVIPLLAGGIKKRYEKDPDLPLDIIIAENMRDAAAQMREWLTPLLPGDYPFERLVGLVETSIGKMVPIIPDELQQKDPLKVFAEPYNELILDGTAFRRGIPGVKQLAPKKNIRAWVDRKAFVHNLGHATAAYRGAWHHPQAKYMYEVLRDEKVLEFTHAVMRQASGILMAQYPEDFTLQELRNHIDDLLERFRNRALGDTIFRVGQDLRRKLGPGDRFMGIIRMAEQQGMDYGMIAEALAYGFMFRGKDEFGRMVPADLTLARKLAASPENTLVTICGLSRKKDVKIISSCMNHLEKLIKFSNK